MDSREDSVLLVHKRYCAFYSGKEKKISGLLVSQQIQGYSSRTAGSWQWRRAFKRASFLSPGKTLQILMMDWEQPKRREISRQLLVLLQSRTHSEGQLQYKCSAFPQFLLQVIAHHSWPRRSPRPGLAGGPWPPLPKLTTANGPLTCSTRCLHAAVPKLRLITKLSPLNIATGFDVPAAQRGTAHKQRSPRLTHVCLHQRTKSGGCF